MPTGKQDFERVRWSVLKAAHEFKKDPKTVKRGLREINAKTGVDGKYSSDDMVRALFDLPKFEYQAKMAQFKRQIAEAEIAEAKRAEVAGKMVDVKQFRIFALDLLTFVVSFIRHSKMSEEDKRSLIASISTFERKTEDNTHDNGERRAVSGSSAGSRAVSPG